MKLLENRLYIQNNRSHDELTIAHLESSPHPLCTEPVGYDNNWYFWDHNSKTVFWMLLSGKSYARRWIRKLQNSFGDQRDMQQFVFIIVNSILQNLLSWLSFGLRTGFYGFSKLAFPCIPFPCFCNVKFLCGPLLWGDIFMTMVYISVIIYTYYNINSQKWYDYMCPEWDSNLGLRMRHILHHEVAT